VGGWRGRGGEDSTLLAWRQTLRLPSLSHCAHTSRARRSSGAWRTLPLLTRALAAPFLLSQKTKKKNQCPPLTEASLSGLDAAAADLRTQIARVDGDILEAVRAQDAPAGKAR